jgi:prophage DNA circulation protein
MSRNSPRDVTESAEEYERASYQQMMAELERRRAAMVARQARITTETRLMAPLQAALAEQNGILQRLVKTPKEQQDTAQIFQCTSEVLLLVAQIQAHQSRIDEILGEP